eukprot:3894010-Amphidinium_carterae.1
MTKCCATGKNSGKQYYTWIESFKRNWYWCLIGSRKFSVDGAAWGPVLSAPRDPPLGHVVD